MSILANILGFGSKILSWKGFHSWKFWTGLFAALMLSWVLWSNHNLNEKVSAQAIQITAAESQLAEAIKINNQLNMDIVSLQLGKVIDEELVRDNQIEIDRMRKEHDERVQEVNRQKPSGPAPAAVICAITRVCD